MSFLSFPHRHNFLAPIQCVEKAEEESKPHSKKRAWKSRISIPDYRKTKIGEYQDKNERNSCDDVSDAESFSSEDSAHSDKTVNTQETSIIPEGMSICAGCDRQFDNILPSTPVPGVQYNEHSRRNPFVLKCNTQNLNKFSSTNRYRCMWPGCSLVVCNECEPLLRKRREQGGAYGNLQRVREIWASMREAEQKVKQEPSASREVIRPYNKISPGKPTDYLILTGSIPITDIPQVCDKAVTFEAMNVIDSKENNRRNASKGGILIQTVEVVVDGAAKSVDERAGGRLSQQGSLSVQTTISSTEMAASQIPVKTPA